MDALLDRLASLDGPMVVGCFLAAVAVLIVLPGLLVLLGKPEPGESLSERHDRLDAEALADANRAAFGRLGRSANR